MIVVTGGAGFIGSNLVKALNERGHTNIIVVDDLTQGEKFVNIADCHIADYIDKDDFLQRLEKSQFSEGITGILHQGACSDTTEWDGRYMMKTNYEYSKSLLHYSLRQEIPFIYASSAAVYWGSDTFIEQAAHEKPLNVYGYSKLLFDQYVRHVRKEFKSLVVGLRYFNVYGPREQHKGKMASVAYHLNQQFKRGESLKLFGAYGGYDAGMQSRDFIYVQDVVDVNLWFLEQDERLTGIYNLGTGRAEPFKAIAEAVIEYHGQGEIEYIDFPDSLKGHYQSYTCADIQQLRNAGYQRPFRTVAQGTYAYLEALNHQHA